MVGQRAYRLMWAVDLDEPLPSVTTSFALVEIGTT